MNRLLGRLQLLALTLLAIGPILVTRRGRKTHQGETLKKLPTATLDATVDKGWSGKELREEDKSRIYSITDAGRARLEEDEERRAVRRVVTKLSGVEAPAIPVSEVPTEMQASA